MNLELILLVFISLMMIQRMFRWLFVQLYEFQPEESESLIDMIESSLIPSIELKTKTKRRKRRKKTEQPSNNLDEPHSTDDSSNNQSFNILSVINDVAEMLEDTYGEMTADVDQDNYFSSSPPLDSTLDDDFIPGVDDIDDNSDFIEIDHPSDTFEAFDDDDQDSQDEYGEGDHPAINQSQNDDYFESEIEDSDELETFINSTIPIDHPQPTRINTSPPPIDQTSQNTQNYPSIQYRDFSSSPSPSPAEERRLIIPNKLGLIPRTDSSLFEKVYGILNSFTFHSYHFYLII